MGLGSALNRLALVVLVVAGVLVAISVLAVSLVSLIDGFSLAVGSLLIQRIGTS